MIKKAHAFVAGSMMLVTLGCNHPTAPVDDVFTVQYEVYAPHIETAPFLAGSAEALGGWRPDGAALESIGNGAYRGAFDTPAAEVECKLTLGTWATEALDEEGYLRTNRILDIASDTLIRDTVMAWNDGTATSRVYGQVTGNVADLGEIEIDGLLPRKVWTWAPEDGRAVSTVLLMHDGRNLFDPSLANFGVDWGVDEVATGLLEEDVAVAVMGVDCTDERFTDYSWTDAGRSYVEWLATEGIAIARAQFNCADGVKFYVAGSSMGGLISLIALDQHPDAFDGAICMSPAFAYKGFDHSEILQAQGLRFGQRPVWIDNGTVGLEAELQPGIDRMTALLEAEAACSTTRIYEGARHFEADWGERLAEAITWVNGQSCAQQP
jgi:predicted alpha/beta superfamily hydrolase